MTAPSSTDLTAHPAPDNVATKRPIASFAGTLAEHALAWHRPDWTEARIAHDITRLAVTLIPAAQGAAILSMADPGELSISAAHGHLPDLTLPAHTASDRSRRMADLPSPHGWPVFTGPPGSSRAGSTICTPLGSGHTMFGTLLIAVDDHHPADADTTTTMLTVLAMHASNALAATRDNTNLHLALGSRDVIGQAKGILMERRRITADAAFTELTRLSQVHNVKLRDLCDQLVATGEIADPPARAAKPARP